MTNHLSPRLFSTSIGNLHTVAETSARFNISEEPSVISPDPAMGRPTGRNRMCETQPKCLVEVDWVKPSGRASASTARMLSITEEALALQSETPWLAFTLDGTEGYLFESLNQAKKFKTEVESLYTKNPRYFVVDGEGNVVKDKGGDPIVAWVPNLTISILSDEEIADRMDLEFVGKGDE